MIKFTPFFNMALLWRNRLCLSAKLRHCLSSTKYVWTTRRNFMKSTLVCSRNKSSSPAPFVPIHVKPNTSGENIGAELAGEVDKNALLRVLRIFFQNKLVTTMAVAEGLNEHLVQQAFASFRAYCIESSVLPTELHIKLCDIINGNSHVDDLYPFFMQHCRSMFPHLECMDELKQISDLQSPPQWYPETRAMKRKFIFHAGPTNSGKTYMAMQAFLNAESSVYCGPLRMLAQEIYNKSRNLDIECDLVTGEERILCKPDKTPANRVSCTVEMTSITNKYDVAVIDEIQMIADPQRGWAWTRALLGVCAREVHVCGEKSAVGLVKNLVESAGETLELREYKRLTELSVCSEPLLSLENVQDGDCIVCFSKNDIFQVSRTLEAMGRQVAVIYGGLPPGTKLAHANKFNDTSNACNVMVATDAIGMGINLSIRRIIFYSLRKPTLTANGESVMEYISVSQALQIAGRAGRFQTHYDKGYVTTFTASDLVQLKKLLSSTPNELQQAGLHPTVEQIELYSYYLPKASLSNIVSIFYNLMKLDTSRYFLCNMDAFIKISDMLEHVTLPLRVRFVFCCAPVNFKTPLMPTILVKFAKQFSQNKAISAAWTKDQTQWPRGENHSLQDLIHMETVFDILDLYLWLSYRFPNVFVEPGRIKEMQKELDEMIQNLVIKLLQKITLRKKKTATLTEKDSEITEGLIEEDSPLNIDTDPENPGSTAAIGVIDSGTPLEELIRSPLGVNKKMYGQLTTQLVQAGILTHETVDKLHQEWTVLAARNIRSGLRERESSHRRAILKKRKL